MTRELDKPLWHGQRPWFEIWFAVILDENRRRALWIRQTMFVPKRGEARATVWGAWFDADRDPPSLAGKKYAAITGGDLAKLADRGEELIRVDDNWFARTGAAGAVEGLHWDVTWSGGKSVSGELPWWLPTPTHARTIVHDADASGTVKIGGEAIAIRGRAIAMHLWGKRRVPTLQWIWAPWLGDGSLEVSAVSLRDSFSLGLSSLKLDSAAKSMTGNPATAAHPHGLVTATVAGARRLVHARAWAEPKAMVGYVYRDTDDRDLMVAQSDIGSAHLEVFTRSAPGALWHPIEERRASGGVAVEIHQRTPLPEVSYLGWDETVWKALPSPPVAHPMERVEWPAVGAIVALGLTYADHVRETGQKIDRATPPVAFQKHAHSVVFGDGTAAVPTSSAIVAALDELEPGLGAEIGKRFPFVPAVMDYEGEIALVALGPIDDEALAAGVAQPFGLAAANDLTARLCQVLGEGRPRPYAYWACAKSFPQFLPMAARVWAPPGGLQAFPELTITTRVNGEERQRASTRELIYDLPTIARTARKHLGRALVRGDVILTGTPAGVGLKLGALQRLVAARVTDRFRKADLLVSTYATSNGLLRPGDVIEVDAGLAGHVRTRLTL
ncbi:MAG: Fumarylacetoacetate hydrolase family protein [Myxococcales bacterium]|nr:Fumarylacetoacetate hydrolase family protein [Myxococcales bacterium]